MNTNEMSLEVLKTEADLIRRDGVWPGFRWPDEFKKKVSALHQDGVSVGEIAAETRIAIDSVKAWVGAKKSPQRREKRFIEVPIKKAEISEVCIALENGKRIEGLKFEEIKELLLSGAL